MRAAKSALTSYRPGWVAGWALALGLIGCNNVSTSVLVQGIASPESGDEPDDEGGCTYASDGDEYLLSTVMNTFGPIRDETDEDDGVSDTRRDVRQTHRLVARVLSTMSPTPTVIESNPSRELVPPNQLSPIRFDFRWECDSSGFAPNQGPFILPQFSLTQPFCLTDREDTEDFVGFDVVSATGQSVDPGEQGIVSFEVIPQPLGQAFDELFQLAFLSEQCCTAAGGCQNAASSSDPNCANLANLLAGVSGGALNIGVPEDIQRWRPFSIYAPASFSGSATLPLRIRGRFEFQTAAGDTVTSTELLHDIRLCRGCSFFNNPCTI